MFSRGCCQPPASAGFCLCSHCLRIPRTNSGHSLSTQALLILERLHVQHPSTHRNTHTHAHQHISNLNVTISLQVSVSPNVFWLAERNKDGERKGKTTAAAVLSSCHIPTILWLGNLTVFHPFIIHLSGENIELHYSRKLIYIRIYMFFCFFSKGAEANVQVHFHWAAGFASVAWTFKHQRPSRPPPTNETPTLMICGHTWSHLWGGRVVRYATNGEDKVQLSDVGKLLFPPTWQVLLLRTKRTAVGHGERDWRDLTEGGGGQSSRRPFIVKEASPGNKQTNVQFS